MVNNKRAFLVFIAFFIQITVQAQNTIAEGENEGFMRSDGKIYVVLAIVLTILAGFLFYLVRLDRKITDLEKQKH
jgi:hypothetical protein